MLVVKSGNVVSVVSSYGSAEMVVASGFHECLDGTFRFFTARQLWRQLHHAARVADRAERGLSLY